MKSQAMDSVDEHEPEISRLPEGCIAHVLSLTSPQDSCAVAAVSSTFRSAVGSDAVWERFLPPDYREILSRAMDEVVFSSKKDLFVRLCRPVLIDGGNKSFALERSTGNKCFMLSARELWITWSDHPQYWKWITLSESRFSEVAELTSVCWLEINGKMNTAMLSLKTTYVALLVFKLSPRSFGLGSPFHKSSISVGASSSENVVTLEVEPPQRASREMREVPHARTDGWMEVALGEFFNDDGGDGEVKAHLLGRNGTTWKHGLIVEGIEFRPK